jgi:hypothetical protein
MGLGAKEEYEKSCGESMSLSTSRVDKSASHVHLSVSTKMRGPIGTMKRTSVKSKGAAAYPDDLTESQAWLPRV